MREEPFNTAVRSKEKRTSGRHETLTPSLAPTPHTRPPADTFRHHSTKWRILDKRFVTEMFHLVTMSRKVRHWTENTVQRFGLDPRGHPHHADVTSHVMRGSTWQTLSSAPPQYHPTSNYCDGQMSSCKDSFHQAILCFNKRNNKQLRAYIFLFVCTRV